QRRAVALHPDPGRPTTQRWRLAGFQRRLPHAPGRAAGVAPVKGVRGFTLLEVLVALAIFGIVAAVVLTAAGRSLNNASRLETLTLAAWIADNRLTELQLQQPVPSIGRESRELEFAGRRWQTLSDVQASAD